MGLVLGIDGKRRAMEAAVGVAVPVLPTVYVALLSSMPLDADGFTLVELADNHEFNVNANFYTGRLPISLGSVAVDHDGAVVDSMGSPVVEWENTTGSSITIEGFFITDASSGSVGQVLWVGTPDIGSAVIGDGEKAEIKAGELRLKID